MTVELAIASLAAGGDGVGRDDTGRVTFVPATAPGDRVVVNITKATKSFARGELAQLITPGASRVVPSCRHAIAGCGGCSWQHVARAEQLAAKQAIVEGALRKLAVTIHPIADPGPALGWRRRARFHVVAGVVGLYAHASHRVIAIDACPQLEPALDAALAAVTAARPPDGELVLAIGHRGEIVIGVERAWPAADAIIGRAGIVGVDVAGRRIGITVIEIEPGLVGGPWDFAQASAAGNRALVARTLAAVGDGSGRLLELYAGAGNFTRGLVAAGWDVLATDHVAPVKSVSRFEVGPVERVLAARGGPVDVIVLDPPRTGAAEAMAGILRLAPRRVVYVSCDPATLARDLARLDGNYVAGEAWPLDLMPHTSHVEVVMRLDRA
ncbi:MAG TPA: TRAM domain-containing protein [Kofleriaceae bacterium]|nr:TRAM domain-containing protein [Kofleriaceae bacterium]